MSSGEADWSSEDSLAHQVKNTKVNEMAATDGVLS